MEDCVHYLAQLMWVIGKRRVIELYQSKANYAVLWLVFIANMLWALGNMFIGSDADDNPTYIFNM